MSAGVVVGLATCWLIFGSGVTYLGVTAISDARRIDADVSWWIGLMVLTGILLAPLWFVLGMSVFVWLLVTETIPSLFGGFGVVREAWKAVFGGSR